MSNREMCENLIKSLPDFKLGYVLAYLQGISADEEADDTFCKSIYSAYEADTSSDKHETISLEELAADLGVNL